jgi:hypothetical protein
VLRRFRVVLALVAVVAAGALSYPAWGPGLLARLRTDSLRRTFPTLDPQLARQLACDTDAQWDVYCRACGTRPLMDGLVATWRAANGWSFERFARDRMRFERVSLRMGEGLERFYQFPVFVHIFHRLMALSLADDYESHRLSVAYVTTLADSASTEERLARLDRLIIEMVRRGDRYTAMAVQSSAAHLELERGRSDLYRARLTAALNDARALEDDYLACQILGEFATLHESSGHPDSMQACLDEGLELARRHRFPDQTARLLIFDARYATQAGYLARAADRLSEAYDRVEDYGGGSARLRVAIESARFMADVGCWDLAAHRLRLLPPLMREFPGLSEADELLVHEFEADVLRARVAFAAGDTATGGRLLAHWLETLPPWHRRLEPAVVFREWSWGLLRAGDTQRALVLCERGIAHCDSAHMPDYAITLVLRRARLLESLGRLTEARHVTDDAAVRIAASHDADEAEMNALRVMQARLELRDGRIESGRAMLREVYADCCRRRPWIANPMRQEDVEGLSLVDAVHELARLSPAEGYGFEMAWRSLSDRLPGMTATGAAGDPFAPGRCEGSCTHLAYRFTSNRLLRWTASPRGVIRDTIAISPAACLNDVREAWTLLQTDQPEQSQWFGPRLATILRRLSVELLPDECRDAAGTIEVSADGPLLGLPFETLPVATTGGPVPLALVHDVAYVHTWDVQPVVRRGPALILSNPALSPELCRRYAWAGRLTGSAAESQTARERWPDATVLSGADATKPVLMRLAAHASYLYIGGHHVTDPAAPLLGFIPLAATLGAPRDATLLESTEIRTLDLSGCRLAVLASCASGAPYRSAANPSPSLGDAFLDAGAAAVITSSWDVGDEETRAFMQDLMRRRGLETDPVHALACARRDAMQGAVRVPPRVWAAWSVGVRAAKFDRRGS